MNNEGIQRITGGYTATGLADTPPKSLRFATGFRIPAGRCGQAKEYQKHNKFSSKIFYE